MRAYQILDGIGLEKLRLTEMPEPEPKEHEILVKVKAVSLNYRDVMTLEGTYMPAKHGIIPLSDGTGEVVAAGANVSQFKVGDRVAGCFFPNWIHGTASREMLALARGGGEVDGMAAEFVAISEESAVHIPEQMSYEEASTLPCAGLTAWCALIEEGGLQPGERVLALGTGGVSVFAMQFALMAGAEVVITSSSDSKLKRAEELGAHHGINYRTCTEWDEEVLKLTSGKGVDHVVEVGGAGTLNRSLRAVKTGGLVSLIGVLAESGPPVNHAVMLGKKIRLNGIYVGSRSMFEAMISAMTLHKLKPVIGETYPFEELHQAYTSMHNGSHFGKIVVRVNANN